MFHEDIETRIRRFVEERDVHIEFAEFDSMQLKSM
jgi:hypothetical protein